MDITQLSLFGAEENQQAVVAETGVDRKTEAMEKLRSEMTANANNPYVQVVGDFLMKHLKTNPVNAENIMIADKTILKSLDAMRTEAQKKKVGNCAVLTDAEGFAIVLQYFGIETTRVGKGRN